MRVAVIAIIDVVAFAIVLVLVCVVCDTQCVMLALRVSVCKWRYVCVLMVILQALLLVLVLCV